MNSRRTFLRVVGTATVGGLAGCGGGGEDAPPDDSTTEETTATTTTEQTTTTTEETTTTTVDTPVEPGRWTMTQGDPGHVGLSPAPGIGPDRPSVRWKRSTNGGVTSDIVLDEETAYVGADSGRVYALSRADGSVQWQKNYGRMKGLALDGDTLYVSADSIYALQTGNGSQRWRSGTEGKPATPPVVYDGTVYVADDSPRLYAVSGGKRKWRTLEMLGYIPQVGAGPDGLFMGHGGGLSRIDPSNGTQQWRYETDSQVTAAPTVVNGRVIAPFAGGRIVNLRASDSKDRIPSRMTQTIQTSVAVDDTGIYVSGTTAKVHKLSLVDGSERWQADLSSPSYSAPALAGDYIYAADNGHVRAFTRDNGEAAWKWDVSEDIRGGLAPVGDSIYLGTRGWNVYALSASE